MLLLSALQLALQGPRMPFVKMFIDQFTYWAAGINCIYVYRYAILEFVVMVTIE